MTTTTAVRIERLSSPRKTVEALVWSPSGEHLAVAAGRRVVVAADGDVVLEREATTIVYGLIFDATGARLAAACKGGQVRVWGMAGEEAKLRGDAGGFASVAWTRDGGHLVAGHYEPRVSLFCVAEGKELRILDPDVFDDEGRTAVLSLPDGSIACTAYNGLLIYPPPEALVGVKRPKKEAIKARGHVHLVDAAVSPDGRAVAVVGNTEEAAVLYVWSLETRERLLRQPLTGAVLRVAWSPDGATLYTVDAVEEGVRAWQARDGKRVGITFAGAELQSVVALAVHPTLPLLVAGTERGDVLRWTLPQ